MNLDFSQLSLELSSHRKKLTNPSSFYDSYTYDADDFIGSGCSASVYRCCSLSEPKEDLIVKISAYTDENQDTL